MAVGDCDAREPFFIGILDCARDGKLCTDFVEAAAKVYEQAIAEADERVTEHGGEVVIYRCVPVAVVLRGKTRVKKL